MKKLIEHWLNRPQELSTSDRLILYRSISNQLLQGRTLADSFALMNARLIHTRKNSHSKSRLIRGLTVWTNDLRAGKTLESSLKGWIPRNELTIVMASEQSGLLGESFKELIELVLLKQDLTNMLIKALAYPIVLIGGALAITAFICLSVVPEVAITANPKDLHGSSWVLVELSKTLKAGWLIFLICFAVAFIGFILSLSRWTHPSRTWLDRKPPFSIYRLTQGIATMRAYQVLTQAGVQSGKALSLLTNNASPYLASRIKAITKEVISGTGLGKALDRTKHEFPDSNVILNILLIAEDERFSQNLETVLTGWVRDAKRKIEGQAQVMSILGVIFIGIVTLLIFDGLSDLSLAAQKIITGNVR